MLIEERTRCLFVAMLSLVVTVLGLVVMDQAGGMGSFAFALYGPLWVLFGLGIAVDSLRGCLRKSLRH